MIVRMTSIVTSASLLLFCSVSTVALADGMPFAEPKPQQILTPIDKSLSVPAKAAPQPASVVPVPAPAPAPAPAPQPQAEVVPPVPESRIVDVQPNTSFFGLSVGVYDPQSHGTKSTAFNVEWQPGVKIVGYLQPLFGAMATTKGALLGYAGIGVPFNITDHVFVMPSVALGAYKNGGDYDLGRSIVERVGTELAYQFDDKSRLGLNFDALTNGTSLQRGDRAEMVSLTYTMPFNALSGSAEPAAAQMPAPLVSSPAPAAVAPPPSVPAPVHVPAAAPTPAAAPVAAPAPAEKPLPHELP